MRLHRQIIGLNDAIDTIDQRLVDAKHALPKASIEEQTAFAWTLLTAIELEFINAELRNCINSRVYFLNNYWTIQTEQGILTCMSPLFDLQWIIEEALEKEIQLNGQAKVIALKPRQSGGTEYANGVMGWRTLLTPYAYTVSVAQAPDVAAHIQRKVNIAYDHLPWWMRPERQYHSKGEYLEFNRKDLTARSTDPGLGSVWVTTHAMRETGVAIGRTVRSAHFSEVSRWPDGQVYTGDIEPSMNAPDTVAIAESTALGEDGFFFNLWSESMEGDSDWIPVFLPVYRAKKFSLPLKPSQLPFELTEIEQGMKERIQQESSYVITDEFINWRRRRIKSSIKRTGYPYAHLESYPAFPEEAFQSSGDAAFPRHKIDEQGQRCIRRPAYVGEILFQGMNAASKLLLNEVRPDHALEKRERFNRLFIWEKPLPQDAYYIGADCGNGNGPDFTVAQVLRAGYGNNPDVQVAEWVGFEQPEAFARILYALGSYYNKCEIAVEYAVEGMTTAHELMNALEYPNIYRPRNRDRIGKQLASFMHWQTNSKTKPLIRSKMSETLLEDQIVIRSEYALAELRKCVNNGINATSFSGLDSHDDAALSICVALFCLRETMPELRQQANYGDGSNQSPTVGARVSGGAAVVYGIYDLFFRLRGQTRDLARAQEFIASNPGYAIKPIQVSKANTAYSIVHHGGGIERELLAGGVDSWDITPAVVSAYREATGRGSLTGYQMQPGQPAFRQPPGAVGTKPVAAVSPQSLSARLPAMAASALESEWLNAAVGGGSELGGEL